MTTCNVSVPVVFGAIFKNKELVSPGPGIQRYRWMCHVQSRPLSVKRWVHGLGQAVAFYEATTVKCPVNPQVWPVLLDCRVG
jgi:hypothetical protein